MTDSRFDEDRAYYGMHVSLSSSTPDDTMGPGQFPVLPAEPESPTTEIWLDVRIVNRGSESAMIELFDEFRAVADTQLADEPPADTRVYPTGPQSPYTSLEELISELRAEIEDGD